MRARRHGRALRTVTEVMPFSNVAMAHPAFDRGYQPGRLSINSMIASAGAGFAM